MATKLSRVKTYHAELPFVKIHDPSIIWFCEVTRQLEYYISSLAQYPWKLN